MSEIRLNRGFRVEGFLTRASIWRGYFLAVLRFELRASLVLGKRSTTWIMPVALEVTPINRCRDGLSNELNPWLLASSKNDLNKNECYSLFGIV
jgi:hypothetical protein